MSDSGTQTPPTNLFSGTGFVASNTNDNKPPISKDDIRNQWSTFVAKRSEAVMVELPSGLMVEARRPNLFHLFQKDQVPDALSPIVGRWIELVNNGAGADKIIEDIQNEVENDPMGGSQKMMDLIDYVFVSAVVFPQFCYGADTDSPKISIDNVLMEDKYYFFQWAQGVDEGLATFRRAAEEFVATAQNGENVFDLAKRMFGD